MKKVTKLAMFLLAGTLATGFVSCSSDDDEPINTTILTPEQQSALSQAASESSQGRYCYLRNKILLFPSNYLCLFVYKDTKKT